jgi:hypothetical protein
MSITLEDLLSTGYILVEVARNFKSISDITCLRRTSKKIRQAIDKHFTISIRWRIDRPRLKQVHITHGNYKDESNFIRFSRGIKYSEYAAGTYITVNDGVILDEHAIYPGFGYCVKNGKLEWIADEHDGHCINLSLIKGVPYSLTHPEVGNLDQIVFKCIDGKIIGARYISEFSPPRRISVYDVLEDVKKYAPRMIRDVIMEATSHINEPPAKRLRRPSRRFH